MIQLNEELIKGIIIKAGGKFRAIQKPGDWYPDDYAIWFDDIKGSTKLLPLSQFSEEAVRARVQGTPKPYYVREQNETN